MTRIYRLAFRTDDDDRDEQADADRQTASLAALALLLMLVVAGLFLIRTLANAGAVQDCLLAGGRNCDAIVTARALPSFW